MNESWRNASYLLPTSSASSNSSPWPPMSTSLLAFSSTASSLSTLGSSTAAPTETPGFPYEPWEMIIIALVAGSLSIITVLGNIMVILSFKIDKQLQTISNYYLFSLAVADFVIGLVSMPLFTMYLLLDRWPLGPVVCDTWLALDYLASNASVLNLLIISFDRYFSVTRPLTYRARRTTKKAACMIASAWLISLALWPPWIYAWPYIEGQRKVPEDKCFIQFLETNTSVTLVTAVAAFYLPVSVMIGLYYRIWRETEQRKKDLSYLQADNQQSRNTSKRSNSSDEVVNVIDHNNAAARANSDDDAADAHRLVANARGGLSLISESDRYAPGKRRGTGGSGIDDRRRRSRWDWMSDIFTKSNKHHTGGRQTAGGAAAKINKRRRKSTGGMADKKYRFSIPSLDEVAACTELGSRMASYYPPPILQALPLTSQNRRQQSSSSSSSAARVNVTQGTRKSPHRRHHPNHHSQRHPSKQRNNPSSQPDQTQSAAEAASVEQDGPVGSGQHRRSIHRAPARRCLSSDSVYTILIQLPADGTPAPFVAKLKSSDDNEDIDEPAPRLKSMATCTTDDDDDDDVPVTKISVTSTKKVKVFERQPSIRMICEEPDIILTRTPSTKSNSGGAAAITPTTAEPAANGRRRGRPRREETVESAADDDDDCCSSDENDEEEDEDDEESIRRKIPKGPYPPGSPIAALRGFLSDYSMKQQNPTARIRAQTSQDSSGRDGPGSPTTSSSRRSSVFPASGASSTRNLVSRGANKGNKGDKKRRKNHERKQDSNRAARTLSAILGAFIFTWTPYNVLALLKNLLKSEQEEDFIPKELWNFAYYLCYINSTVNPMCYALCNAAFRRTYVRILTCKWSVSRTRREAAAGVAVAQAAAAAATAPQSTSASRSNC